MKPCANKDCKQTNPQPDESFYFRKDTKTKDATRRSICKYCHSLAVKKHRATNPHLVAARRKAYLARPKVAKAMRAYRQSYCKRPEVVLRHENYRLKTTYGITLAGKKMMFDAQGGKCVTCFDELDIKTSHIDHCHKTEKVRAILCAACNKSIGLLKENLNTLENIKNYLIAHAKK